MTIDHLGHWANAKLANASQALADAVTARDLRRAQRIIHSVEVALRLRDRARGAA